MDQAELDRWHMSRALALAVRGQGYVEPNPMVGCVIARGAEIIGEGWHRRYGGDHAEIEALAIAGAGARAATVYVTLEPCCHFGKTPPCSRALIRAGVARVVAAMTDPFSAVAGRGLAELQAAGIAVETGVLEAEAAELNAPYLKLLRTGRPWVIAKWAMTLDGKLATRAGASRWISCDESRGIVHQLRGRVDAIIVGRRTADLDDPLLTARPPGPRTPLRVVLDSWGTLRSESRLAASAREAPVLVAVRPECNPAEQSRLRAAGCEVFFCPGESSADRFAALLAELGRRRLTNVLVEGGAEVFGMLLDSGQVDEVHAFVAPKLFGGRTAPSPIGGWGVERPEKALTLRGLTQRVVGCDLYISGRIGGPEPHGGASPCQTAERARAGEHTQAGENTQAVEHGPADQSPGAQEVA